MPVGDPRFGKVYPCPQCSQAAGREGRRQLLRQMSNLDAYAGQTFDTFRTDVHTLTDSQAGSLRQARELCIRYAAEPQGWLLLQGGYGCGKTHLAAAIANACVDAGMVTLFLTIPDLLDHLRSSFGPSSEISYDELFDRVLNVSLLVLDDLGAESPTPWALEKLYQLVNHRYSYRLATVFTTNADPETLDARIRSRLLDEHLTRSIKIDAPDHRRGSFTQTENPLTNLTLYADMSFDTWDRRSDLPQTHRDNLQRAFDLARRYAEAPAGWLVLTGSYGCGKTHLAAAIAGYRQLQGDQALFVTAPDLLDHLRATFGPGSLVTYDWLFNDIRNAPLLVLDDLGVENASPWAREKLFQIIDHRYRARLATIITMSRPLDEIDERLASRMSDPARGTVFAITAPGYRGRKASGKRTELPRPAEKTPSRRRTTPR